MCASRVNPTCVDRSGRWRSRISGAPLHFVTRCTASGTREALAHRRGNLDQLADLPFRQWRLQISRGYRLLNDRIESDDPVRRQHVLREEFIAQALGESFRYARELGVTFERVRAGIHPVNGLAIGLHEAGKNILASTLVITTRTVSRRMARTSLARATTRIFPCSMASTPNGASAQPTST